MPHRWILSLVHPLDPFSAGRLGGHRRDRQKAKDVSVLIKRFARAGGVL